MRIENPINTPVTSTPSTPAAAGRVLYYFKANGLLCTLDSTGTERQIGAISNYASVAKWGTD